MEAQYHDDAQLRTPQISQATGNQSNASTLYKAIWAAAILYPPAYHFACFQTFSTYAALPLESPQETATNELSRDPDGMSHCLPVGGIPGLTLD